VNYTSRLWIIAVVHTDKKIQLVRFDLPEGYENDNINAAAYFVHNKLKPNEMIDVGCLYNAEGIEPSNIVYDMDKR
jgi:hypothetical protein